MVEMLLKHANVMNNLKFFDVCNILYSRKGFAEVIIICRVFFYKWKRFEQVDFENITACHSLLRKSGVVQKELGTFLGSFNTSSVSNQKSLSPRRM